MAQRVRRLAALALTLALVAAACGNSGSDDDESSSGGDNTDVELADGSERDTFVEITGVPGVDDDEIRFSSIATTTGNPLGTNIGPAYNAGIEAYFEYRNGEGGIYGRDLVLASKRDDELLAHDREAQAVVSENDSFGAFSATLNSSGLDILADDGVPTFIWNIAPEYSDQRSIFGQVAPLCVADCSGRYLSWMAQELGATTVGIIAYGTTEVSKVCAESQRDSIERFSDETGLEVGFFDNTLPFGLPNGIGPEVSAMKDAGVDFISTCVDINAMKTLGDEMAAQELDATINHPNTYNADFIAANADIFEGDIITPAFLAFEAGGDIPLRDAYLDTIDPELAPEELAFTGWLNAHLAFTGLLSAGPEFDRETVVNAIRSIDDYTADGLSTTIDWSRQIGTPTDDTPDIDTSAECFNAVQVQDGEFVPWTGDEENPWVCFGQPRSEWVEPEFVNYAE